MSTRCSFCYSPEKFHFCVAKGCKKENQSNSIYDWKYETSNSLHNIYTMVGVRKNFRQKDPLVNNIHNLKNCEYVIYCDTRDKYEGMEKVVPPKSSNYAIISMYKYPEPPLSIKNAALRRLQKNSVFGNSTVTKDEEFDVESFLNEAKIINTLCNSGNYLALSANQYQQQASEKVPISIRLSKGFVDFHFRDNACLLLFTQTNENKVKILQNSSEKLSDRAYSLLYVPLSSILALSASELLSYLSELAMSNPIILETIGDRLSNPESPKKIGSHFKMNIIGKIQEEGSCSKANIPDNLKHLCPWAETSTFIDINSISVIIGMWVYDDTIIFDLPGGKRELFETSLECAIRETSEEFGIRFDDENTAYNQESGELTNIMKESDKEWCIAMHILPSINIYIVVNRSILII